jgi:hypothetical protein
MNEASTTTPLRPATRERNEPEDGELTYAQLGRELTTLARSPELRRLRKLRRRLKVSSKDQRQVFEVLDILVLRARLGKDYADRSPGQLGHELGLDIPERTAERDLKELAGRLLEVRKPEKKYGHQADGTPKRNARSYRNVAELVADLAVLEGSSVTEPAEQLAVRVGGMQDGHSSRSEDQTDDGLAVRVGRHQKKETTSPSVQSAVGSGEPPSVPERQEGQQSSEPSARAGQRGRTSLRPSGNASGRKPASGRPRRSERSERRSVPVGPPPHITRWLGHASDGKDEKRLRVLTALDAETHGQYGVPATEDEQFQRLLSKGLVPARRQPKGRTA